MVFCLYGIIKRDNMKKFTNEFNVEDYEVLTDIGFVPIDKIYKTVPYLIYTVSFDDDKVLLCADTHILIDENDKEVYAKDSINAMIKTIDGVSKVIGIEKSDDSLPMYDLELSYHHKYYTDDILSHNTTTVAAFLLHMALFNKDYTIAILANKKPQAEEILDRLKTMYQNLPWWLQVGVKRWNIRDILLTIGKRGTSVLTESTVGSSIRGKSVNCLSGDTIVTLKHDDSGEEFTFSLERLYEVLNNDELFTDD